ncbi:MAG: hypothetical protein V1681_03340 [Candidatus Neomarinimicrobiota bacterium]
MKRLCLLLICLVTFSRLGAQDPVEEMMRKIKERTDAQMKKSEQYVKDYIARDDSLFAKFLEEDWKMFEAYKGRVRDKMPKPKSLPAAEPKKEAPLPGSPANITAKPQPTPPPPPPPPPPPVPQVQRGQKVEVQYFDANLSLVYDENTKIILKRPIDNQAISDFWDAMGRTDFSDLKKQIDANGNSMRLNDYGYTLLLSKIGKKIYGSSPDEIRLFTWFMLIKAGFNARVGYNTAGIYLLLPIKNMVYSTPFLTLDGIQYFAVKLDDGGPELNGSLYTYDGKYPGADRSMSLMINAPLAIKNATSVKNLSFDYGGQHYTMGLKYEVDAINFFKYYPQTDWDVYFSYKVSPSVNNAILTSLKPLISGRSEPDAVNLILRFVQTAFDYKTDDDNFGWEKPLFPDETIYYDFSDCEDRSIMFAYLIRDLLGLEVLGLHYPGHMATAVKFTSNVTGDTVTFEGVKYLICDPTYINADIGMCMPQFQSVNPECVKMIRL